MKKFARILSLVIVVVMLGSMLAACGKKRADAPTIDTPLVVAYNRFSEKFSPFFSDTAYDADVAGMTQISLMTTDRLGQIIMNGIKGETHVYNNTKYTYKGAANLSVDYDKDTDRTTYKAEIRKDMHFSDGVPVTADDIIFTYYTYLDPSYVGSTSLSSYKIIGLKEYQTQTPTAVLERYTQYAKDIYEAGPDHEWSSSDAWTQELQDGYWAEIEAFGVRESQAIIDYVTNNYADNYAEPFIYKTADEVRANEGLQAVLGMVLWGFGDVVCAEEVGEDEECPEEAGYKFIAASGDEYDMVEQFPTAEDYNREITLAYEGDLATAWEVEAATNNTDILNIVETEFIKEWGPKDKETGGEGVPNIAGIKKTSDYSIEVVINGFEAPAVYSILGISITPMHYYGDKELYDYENNKFGFPFGDLSKQQSLTGKPMGAGPYKFVEYDNRIVRFEANEYYYKGCPKIREIQFKETDSRDVASALNTGDADAGELSFNMERFKEVMSYNSNGETTGDVITLIKVDNLGYGYIGINADTVNVAGDPGSDASKNLRKAFATILAIRRDVAIASYYGEFASVINYPISNTSWAAPQPTDDDYQLAFSVDVEGNPIYTADMAPEDKYEAARQAALGYLEAAGYTIEGGKAVAAPAGAKMAYELIVPGDGTGDHPAFAIITDAKADLEKIGIELIINDPADSNILWNALDSGLQEMWTAAWGSTIDPDMYQVYHSNNVIGEGGTDSNHYHIRDSQLDQYIMDARMSDDQDYRKAVYKQALDVVIDWAVEIPTYQRQNATIFSTKRIVLSTLTPDITTFWGWMNDIELLETVPTP
ncbi:MAG TPA: ABC transporter substrate-binding protein [Anaerolineaceae bacterium]|nr:ABC transporter substrate-binding protein [Anaerolineaceae bacterium]